MYMKLHEVSEVIAGYTFRGAIKPDNTGDLFVFQAKDLVQGVPFDNTKTLTRISHDTLGIPVTSKRTMSFSSLVA